MVFAIIVFTQKWFLRANSSNTFVSSLAMAIILGSAIQQGLVRHHDTSESETTVGLGLSVQFLGVRVAQLLGSVVFLLVSVAYRQWL